MVFERVKEMISNQLDIDIDRITEDTSISEDLGADSLDLVELMMAAEEEFMMAIDEDGLKNIHTVGDIVRYIEDNM